MEKLNEDKTQPLALKNQSTKETLNNSQNLSKELCLKLVQMIDKITEGELTTDKVNSACLAANQIHKLLDLNYKIKKDGL